jgi:inorganic pyrophosphatase
MARARNAVVVEDLLLPDFGDSAVASQRLTPDSMPSNPTSRQRSRTSLAHLSPTDDDKNLIAVIETPQGTRTKLDFDPQREAFVVSKMLPEGLNFPFDFGFIPSTLGGDGDPLDVLVLMEEPLPPGTIVPCRLVGVIEATQSEKNGGTEENDRLIAVACGCNTYRDVKKLVDLPDALVEQIEHFFVTYNQEEKKKFTVRGRHGRRRANSILDAGKRRFARKQR